jgi:hypothetical protein
MGKQSGFYAALLLALNPVFWHSGIASALRIQLAIASLAVAAACWRAWQGDRFWVPRSAIVLGLAAGIRPEIGPLLFPLWAVSARRARAKWEDVRFALGVMAFTVLVWLAPAMWASGGPAGYVKACLLYLNDQASVTSGLFGSTHPYATFWRLVVWTLAILPGCIFAAVVAWRSSTGWGVGRSRAGFLALWFVPPFAFACFVHLEDPGQALSMIVVVALLGGYLLQQAVDRLSQSVSRWHALWLTVAALGEAWIIDRHDAAFIVIWTPLLTLGLGALLIFGAGQKRASLPPLAATLFLLTPPVILNLTMFNHAGWYYRGPGWFGAMLEDLNSGLALTSLDHIKRTLAIDDHAIRDIKRLSANREDSVLVIWEHGLATWRKLAYYAPQLPIAVLEHRYIRAGSPPIIAMWRGSHRAPSPSGSAAAVVRAAPGTRIIWLLNPQTEFYAIAQQALQPRAAGSVLYTDLPQTDGSRQLGEYELVW